MTRMTKARISDAKQWINEGVGLENLFGYPRVSVYMYI